jgi:hypothetical protein
MRETGDVIWSTTQESKGAKCKGANTDSADKVVRQLLPDLDKLKEERAGDSSKKTGGAP